MAFPAASQSIQAKRMPRASTTSTSRGSTDIDPDPWARDVPDPWTALPISEEYKAEDELNKSKLAAKHGLESYCITMYNTLHMEGLKEHFEADDREHFEKAVHDALDWLDMNQLAEKDEFVAKQNELESVSNPIMMKVYQAADTVEELQPEGSFLEHPGSTSSAASVGTYGLPPPYPWEVHMSEEFGICYYWHPTSDISSWIKPRLPFPWQEHWDAHQGLPYYWHPPTDTTSWLQPPCHVFLSGRMRRMSPNSPSCAARYFSI